MPNRIDPTLFERLMRLPQKARRDVLEFIGPGAVSASDVLQSASKPTSIDKTAPGDAPVGMCCTPNDPIKRPAADDGSN